MDQQNCGVDDEESLTDGEGHHQRVLTTAERVDRYTACQLVGKK